MNRFLFDFRSMRNKLTIFMLGAYFACVIAFPAHASPDVNTAIGFTSSPRGHVLIPVSINGSAPLIFVLDTGAGKTFVTPGLVAKLGLVEDGGSGAVTLGVHGKAENAVVRIRSVSVGEAQISDIEAVVLDLDHITRGAWQADGVLGMDFLTQFDVRLDFEASVVSFYPAATDRSRCVACPTESSGVAFRTIDPGFIVLPVTVDETSVSAVLDVGSGHSGLNSKAATALGVSLPAMPAGAPAGHGFGLQTGPVRVGETTLAEQATLLVMDHPVMEALALADQPSMLMGTDQLAGRALTICYGLETLFIQ